MIEKSITCLKRTLKIFVGDLTCFDIELNSSLSFANTNLATKSHDKFNKDDIAFFIV